MSTLEICSEAVDIEKSDDSSVKRDKKAKILRVFMRAENAKWRARFEQDATAAGLQSGKRRERGNVLQPLLLAWKGPTNLKATVNKLNRKKRDVAK